jgi:hypothetical protein
MASEFEVSDFIQRELTKRDLASVTAVEAAKWLDRAGLLRDSSVRPGLPLRDVLRARQIRGQRQEPNGRWFIDRDIALAPQGAEATLYCDGASMAEEMDDKASVPEDVQAQAEGTDDDAPLDIAPERRRVKTDKRDVPVETLHNWVQRGKINLQPEFQRQFVWNKKKASRLVESLLLEIPIPVIYVAHEADDSMPVVDGQQRLTSVCAFIEGKFPDGESFRLSSLQVLTELNGKGFKELTSKQQEAILGATLRLIVIEKDSDPDVKFEVFERLNLGAEKLNDQELRNSVYRGSYNALLKELASNPHMLKVMRADQPHRRMADRQLILRFFAMWRATHLKYKSPFKQFMNHEMETNRSADAERLGEMRAVFEKSIEMAYTVFGTHAFRRFDPGSTDNQRDGRWEKNKLNVALWDTLLYTFSFYEKRQIIPIADRVREEFLDLMTNDQKFVDYITATTDQVDRIRYRAEEWRRRLDALVGDLRPEPRGSRSNSSRSCSRPTRRARFASSRYTTSTMRRSIT